MIYDEFGGMGYTSNIVDLERMKTSNNYNVTTNMILFFNFHATVIPGIIEKGKI